jgi:hypothetical protein
MTIPSLSIAHLEELLGLTKKKHAISLELEKIERAIGEFFGGKTKPGRKAKAPAKRGRPPGKKAAATVTPTTKLRKGSNKRTSHGTMKASILAALTEAGADGLSTGEVAEKIRAKKSAVGVWFYTTGKTVEGLTKVGRGRFAFTAS